MTVSNDYPFTVQGGVFHPVPSLMGAILKGGLTSYYGGRSVYRVGSWRIQTVPHDSSGSARLTFTKREVKGPDTTERWVVLAADMDVLRTYSRCGANKLRLRYRRQR